MNYIGLAILIVIALSGWVSVLWHARPNKLKRILISSCISTALAGVIVVGVLISDILVGADWSLQIDRYYLQLVLGYFSMSILTAPIIYLCIEAVVKDTKT